MATQLLQIADIVDPTLIAFHCSSNPYSDHGKNQIFVQITLTHLSWIQTPDCSFFPSFFKSLIQSAVPGPGCRVPGSTRIVTGVEISGCHWRPWRWSILSGYCRVVLLQQQAHWKERPTSFRCNFLTFPETSCFWITSNASNGLVITFELFLIFFDFNVSDEHLHRGRWEGIHNCFLCMDSKPLDFQVSFLETIRSNLFETSLGHHPCSLGVEFHF